MALKFCHLIGSIFTIKSYSQLLENYFVKHYITYYLAHQSLGLCPTVIEIISIKKEKIRVVRDNNYLIHLRQSVVTHV